MAGNDYTTAEGSLNKIRQDLVTLVEDDVAGILGAATDTPADVVEGATARSFVSLLKGIKNYLKTLAGAVSGTKILVTADGTVTANQGTAGAGAWPVDATGQGDVPITLDGEEVAISSVALPSAVVAGQKAVTSHGTAVALGASTPLTSGVRLKALVGNTGDIYVGGAAVASDAGFVLDAGEEVFVEIDNLASVYIDSSVDAEGVSYIGG